MDLELHVFGSFVFGTMGAVASIRLFKGRAPESSLDAWRAKVLGAVVAARVGSTWIIYLQERGGDPGLLLLALPGFLLFMGELVGWVLLAAYGAQRALEVSASTTFRFGLVALCIVTGLAVPCEVAIRSLLKL